MKYNFYKKDGSSFGEKDITEAPFFKLKEGSDALKQVVLAYKANERQGSACAKSRSEVSGSGKKPWRQKGTGNARHGSKRSPIWVGGGVVHGPKPRDYSQKINIKVKKIALRRAIFERSLEKNISLIESFEVQSSKTFLSKSILNKINLTGKTLLIDVSFSQNFILSTRNIANVFLSEARCVNALDFGNYKNLIITEEAFNLILARSQ